MLSHQDYQRPPNCCWCSLCKKPPHILKVTFAGVVECGSLCDDANNFNQTHEVPYWPPSVANASQETCVWAANGPNPYGSPELPTILLPECNQFLVQVTISAAGADDVKVRVDATSGSAAHVEWERTISKADLECGNIGAFGVGDQKTSVPCIPGTTYIDFSDATCDVCPG